MRKNVLQKIMAWPVCAVFMFVTTGQAFAENAGKSDQIHEGNPPTNQEPELESSAKMVDFLFLKRNCQKSCMKRYFLTWMRQPFKNGRAA